MHSSRYVSLAVGPARERRKIATNKTHRQSPKHKKSRNSILALTKDEVPPQSGLDQHSFAQRTRAGEQRVGGEMALVLVQQQVVA